MKTTIKSVIFTLMGILIFSTTSKAQTVSTFEALSLLQDSYWNGSDMPMGTTFTDGNAIFPNFYDTAWGGYWATGWAYSNMQDTITEGFLNMFSAITGSGYYSNNYSVGTQGSVIKLTGNALGKVAAGFYITNGTYAALSMKNGDMVGKKFGGTSGGDPDWFKLKIQAYYNGSLKNDSVDFYLADYRFSQNSQDYIVDTWQWVDISTLGNADSLIFTLSSSDNGSFGMNTPAYFFIDNFTTLNSEVNISELSDDELSVSIYPNPVTDFMQIDINEPLKQNTTIEIFNSVGQLVLSEKIEISNKTFSVSDLKHGLYHVVVNDGSRVTVKNLMKY
ncbi:MAG: DUF4465 domain-containing protein [Bacteroidales bacterium]|nr:DUF4465 domain-containing protein [Bacteroidales bacterium]